MKLKLLASLVWITTFVFLLALSFNCGKKDEQPQTDQMQQQQNTQQQQQQNTQQQQLQTEKIDSTKIAEKKKEEELKKKKEAEEKKKLEEEKKKKEETKINEDGTPNQVIDFAPIFAKRCAKCHGKDGTGKVEGVPNLTKSHTKNKSEKEIISIITNGRQGETEEDEDMPSFKNKLSKEEIEAAAKFVKGL
jgi:cytochrome c6